MWPYKLTFSVYGTTWVGEIYYHQTAQTADELRNSTDVVGDIARKGSFALLLFSLVSLAGSVVLPWVVTSPWDHQSIPANDDDRGSKSIFDIPRIPRIDICTAWSLSQLLFSGSLILAPAMTSYWIVSLVIAFCGL